MSTIYEVASAFRGRVLSLDEAAAVAMVEAYAEAWTGIRAQLERLDQDMQAAKARGEEINPLWLIRSRRLEAIERQVGAQLQAFAAVAEVHIVGSQREAVNAARNMTVAVGEAAQPGLGIGFAPPSADALTHLVGTLADGSPLKTLLDQLPNAAGSLVKKRLIVGVAAGTPGRTVARQIRDDLGAQTLTRSLTIARTEIMRSYREASLIHYRANAQVIRGWVWTADLSSRTCAMCIAMHGTEHGLDEVFGSHPRCRCSPVPLLRVEGLLEVRPGVEWFAAQSEKTQRAILGPAKFDAYQAGDITLPDLVHYESDPDWGPQRREASLKSILAH